MTDQDQNAQTGSNNQDGSKNQTGSTGENSDRVQVPPGFEDLEGVAKPNPQDGNNQQSQGGDDEGSDELEQLKQQAAYWQLIESNPELLGLVEDYFRSKLTGIPSQQDQDAPSPNQPQNPKQSNEQKIPENLKPIVEENRQLREQIQAIQQQFAVMQLQQFAAAHPDMELYRSDMARLMQEIPGLTLDKAYQLAKAQKSADKEPTRRPTTETPRSKPRDESLPSDELAKASRELLDREKFPNIDNAFEAAARKAQSLLDRQGEE